MGEYVWTLEHKFVFLNEAFIFTAFMIENMAINTNTDQIQFNIDHSSPIPLHVQVEELMRKLIAHPDYQNGKLLPKEVELAKLLGISRNTIRQATNKLEHENLLVRKKGVGTRVIKNTVSTRLTNWLSFSSEMHNKGMEFVNYDVKVTWVKADVDVAAMLQIDEGKEILKMERLRGLDKGPFVYFISYFHPRVGLTGKEDFSRHLYEILEQDYSTVPSVSKEKISAMAANSLLAKKLNIKKGDPLLFRKRLVCDPGDRPIEYNLGYYRGDSFAYEIDIKR